MFKKGSFQSEILVKDDQHYPLLGKADVVFQNAGDDNVKIGLRTLKPTETLRICGENTVLTNESINVKFEGNGASPMLWVHFILPLQHDCN
ncbi:hypothetical protein [Mangrovimonas cancribranchiae]|uniref:Uncharacterized protein n=1 Tax=Mangrovimonas cancribranchiae TaxID=3080055 RepID=A0AAU6NY96_9FLAO